MTKPNIKKLGYPLWFKITFYVLTIVLPLTTIVVQGLNSPSTTFKCTFTVLCIALMAWVYIRKFILNKIETRLIARKEQLAHDYEIEVGNTTKCKWLWFTNEMQLAIISGIQILLMGGVILLLAVGIQSAAIAIKGASLLITTLYLIAYAMKFIVIQSIRGEEPDSEVTNE